MEKIDRFILIALSLPLLGLGLASMFNAESLLPKWGLLVTDANGLSTVRSIIGGLLVGSALQILVGFYNSNTTWLLASAMLMAVVIVGRLIGLFLDGFHSAIVGPTIYEIIVLALAVRYHYTYKFRFE